MSTLLVSLSEDNRSKLEPHHDAYATWSVTWESSLESACMELERGGFDVWLVDEELLDHDPLVWLEHVHTHAPRLCMVIFCATPQGQRDRLTWLELGAHDVIYWGALRDNVRAERLFLLLETLSRRVHSAQHTRMQRAHLNRELRGIYQFIHEIGSTLDERAIIIKAIDLFLNACHVGAVAYLEFSRDEHVPEGLDVLFSESEVDTVDVYVGDLTQALADAQDARIEHSTMGMLNVVEQASSDRLLVCLGPQMHHSWSQVLEHKSPVLFRRRPTVGMFPGLEPLWHRLGGGMVFFVPVWGRNQVFGLFVVSELEPNAHDSLMLGAEALYALSSLIGSSLENARHYTQTLQAYETLQEAQDQLVHAEKFAAVGHLAAQIAHEINNPASFIISNMSVMQEYAESFGTFVHAIESSLPEAYHAKLDDLRVRYDLDFMQKDLDVLLERSLSGMQRIHQIVKDLRYFAHDSGPEPDWVDVRALLEATMNLVRHEIKYRADLQTSYDEVPQVFTDANKLSQVFLNLLVNASQALEHGDPEQDVIRVGLMRFEHAVLVFVEDSGVGIDGDDLPRIFEPFFTTKKRGEGSGLGLSISRDILRSLGGDIRVYSESGKGTRFEVMIPKRYDEPGASALLRQSGGFPQPPVLRKFTSTDQFDAYVPDK